MRDENYPAIRTLLAHRRSLLKRIQAAEAKLAMLRSKLTLAEVQLICFGYDVERLRRSATPRKMFKGHRLYRRILDVSRTANRPLRANEIATILAAQDGLDTSKKLTRISGTARVKAAIKRNRKRRARGIGTAT